MSEAILLDHYRQEPIGDNPYYLFFKNSVGQGLNYHPSIGGVYSSPPDYQRGYGVTVRVTPFFQLDERGQAGEGIGSFFVNLFRQAAPVIKSVAKKLLTGAAEVGRDTLTDALAGENLKSSLKKHVKHKVSDNLPSVIADEVNKRIGSGKKRVSSKSRSSSKRRTKRARTSYPALRFIE
jgi:hypothetical protein